MKTISIFIALVLFTFHFTKAQSVSCADSVRSTYYFHDVDDGSQYTEASIAVDTFNLDSGIVRGCTIAGPDANNLNTTTCSERYWSKTILTTDTSGRVIESLIMTGSATGWQNTSRVVYTFDPITNKIASQSNENWDGTSWQQNKLQSWTYNSSLFLDDKIEENLAGGVVQNGRRTLWHFNSDTLLSKNTYLLVGTLWVDDNQYVFSYDANGYRDSLLFQKWNSTTLVWDTIGNVQYYLENGKKLAQFMIVNTVLINSIPNQDTIIFSIDTLENTIKYYELLPTHYDVMGLFYYMIYSTYDYFSGVLKNVWQYDAQWWDDGSDGLAWYCTDNDFTTTYDTSGFITSTIQRARCVMPREFTTTYIYNSKHVLIRQTGYLDSNTASEEYSYNFYFGTTDSIVVFLSPFIHPSAILCQGEYVYPEIAAIGGCGQYHFQWTPNYNLSSDTISNPHILVGDSIVYTITVTDTIGNIGTINYNVFPSVVSQIQLDTLNCMGCVPTISTIYQPNYIYQWYFNGVMIANSDTSSIEPLLSGSYFVEVSSSNNWCVSNSDTVYYVSTLSESSLSEKDFSIYPNPVEQTLYIHLPDNQNRTVTIYNSFGVKVENTFTFINEKEFKIEVKELVAGVYYLELNTSGIKLMKKFIKQ